MNLSRRSLAPVTVIALALGPAALFARLGDSPDEAVQRYGPATPQKSEAPATLTLRHLREDAEVITEFFEGRCHRVSFRKPKASSFSDEETKRLLDENSGGRAWTAADARTNPVAEKLGVKRWSGPDRGTAVRGAGDDGRHVLVIADGVFVARKLRAAAATATAPSGPAAPPAPVALDWTGYDGTGDASAARLTLGARDLGAGAAGLAALRTAIAALPPGSAVKLARYYGDAVAAGAADAAGGRSPAAAKKYPFDIVALRYHAEAHGISLLVPQPN